MPTQGETPYTIGETAQIPQPSQNANAGFVLTADMFFNIVLFVGIIIASVAFDYLWKRKKEKPVKVLCVRAHGEYGIPKRAKKGDAGFDLFCDEDVTVGVDDEASISQGIAVKVPDGAVGLILPRSSANKLGLHVKIGVIDSGYTGPLFALVHNIGKKAVEIKRGMRICQLIPIALHPVVESMDEVVQLPKTERGTSGFGSTGDAAQHLPSAA